MKMHALDGRAERVTVAERYLEALFSGAVERSLESSTVTAASIKEAVIVRHVRSVRRPHDHPFR
jgi:hypothetical protein